MAENHSARDTILSTIRGALGRDRLSADAQKELEQRLKNHKSSLVPARAKGRRENIVARFLDMAEKAACSIRRVQSTDELPEAVADYLRRHNLPNDVTVAPTAWLEGLPWRRAPMVKIRYGASARDDLVSLTPAYAAVAETGTLVMTSGPDHPTTLNFTPDHHIVALHEAQICGGYEDVWSALRTTHHSGRRLALPRTVGMITGPSRTGDIGLKIHLGAHGPRSVHIILIDDGPGDDG